MKESAPLITVGTLCYNTGKHLVETLDSIKNQTYKNIELIIIDDASKDNSVELIRKWINSNNYQCIFIVHDNNKGVHDSAQEVMDLAKGKYMSFSGDDLWVETKTEEQVRLLEEAGDEYGVAYGNMGYINANSERIGTDFYHHEYGEDFMLPQGWVFRNVVDRFLFQEQSALINLEALKKTGFKYNKEYISDDYYKELLLTRHYKAIGVKKIYGYYRILDNSVTRKLWIPEQIHKPHLSQLKMFEEVYNFPKNNREDKEAIYSRISFFSHKLFQSAYVSRWVKVKIAYKLFMKRPMLNTLLKGIVLLITGNLGIAESRMYNSMKSKTHTA